MDRKRLAENRLRLAERYQQEGLVPLKVDAMQKWGDLGKSPYFQGNKGQTRNLRCHQPFVIPPASEPSIFDAKMRMITVKDKEKTALSTFSRIKMVSEV